MTANDHEWTAEALRLHQRYSEEIVEAFDVCPWARHARVAGEVERTVLLQEDEGVQPSLDFVARLDAPSQAGKRVDVGIAIFPRLRCSPRRFEEFVGHLRSADQARLNGRPIFVEASFHPEYPLNPRSPASLVPFFRRSPDPSIQFVRLSVLDEARGGAHGKFMFDFTPESWAELIRRRENPSVTDRVTRTNADRLERETPARLEAIYRSIHEDRERTYARLRGDCD